MFKKHISMLLVCSILFSSLVGMGGQAEAAANENVQISIQPDPEIDVALAVGNSSWNLQNFTNDLKTKLTTKGIASSGVNVQSVETKSVVADASNASLIFQSWKNFSILSGGYNAPAWTTSDYFISGDKLIRSNAGAPRPASGYYDPKSFETTNATYSFTWGIDATNYGSFEHGEAGFLFRMQDEQNYYAYLVDNHSACGNIFLDGGEAIVKVTNGTFQIIAQNSVPSYYAGQKENIKIVTEGNDIKVYRNGALRLQATDSAYTKGGHGFYVWDQYGAYFSNISVESEATKKFSEVIRQPIWRENSERFIANLENNTLADLDQPQTSAEVLTRLINDEVHYVALGTSTNMTQATQFVTRNNGRGTFINNAVYDTAMDQLATYIAAQIKARQKSSSYLLVGEPININVTPSSYKTNTQTAEYPNGRWKVDHDYTYYENNLGQSSLSGQWQKDLPVVFDKPGRYELWFGAQHPNPQYIYVHRRPVAEFDMKVTKGSTYSVALSDRSYDPDGVSSANRGIAQVEWKWRETTSTVWTNGQPPATLPLNKDYLVQLRVLDEQGVWSMPLAKYVSTGSTALKPIADFQLPSKVTTVKPLNVSDSSYDPAGRTVTQKVWTVLKDGKSVYSGPQMITNFKSYGVGTYTVTLKVMNDVNLWSDEYQRTVQVVTDNTNPTISYSPNGAEWTKPGLTVNLDFADDSGVAKTFYKVTGSAGVPSTWDTGSSLERISLQLNNEGEWYIHAKAEDLAGNVTTTKAGPYQIQYAPDVPELKANSITQDSIEVGWTMPNKSFIDGYKYSIRNTVTNKTWDLNLSKDLTDHIQEDNLTPGTKYTYTLQVSNHTGTADSKPIEVLTLPAAPEKLSTSFEDFNSGKAIVNFEAVKSATKYVFTLYEGTNAGMVKVDEKVWTAAGEHSITGLDPGTQYSFKIQAENETGLGGVANSGFLSLPAAPGEFKTVYVTDQSVTLGWLESSTAAQYQLDREQQEVYTGNELQYTDNGLESATEYNYQLAAKNASGFGDVSALNVLTLPGATDVKITKVGAEIIEVEWATVKGADRYIVSLNGSVEAEIPAGTETVQLDSLSPGTQYEVVVKAENKSGYGSYSPIQTITLPSAPDNIQVHHTDDTAVTIDWNDTFGADRYKVYFEGNEIDLSSPSLDISDLTGDTQYTVQIQAGNNSGYGDLEEVTFVTLPTLPAVQIDSYTSNTLDLSWDQQKYASAYRVYDEEGNLLIETDEPNYQLKGLVAGELYTVYISAVNDSGEGERAMISQLTLPEAPADIEVKHVEDTHVTVSWPDTPGADRYRIYHDGKTVEVPAAQIDLLDLIGNKSYKIEVQAGNEAGFGIKTTVEFLTLPVAPFAQVEKYGSNEIHLSWDTQDNVTYRVYDENGLVAETEDAQYQLEDLKPGETYSYWVSAVNSSGEGAKSEVSQRTLPGGWDSKNPGLFVVVSDITTSSAKITWKAAEGAEYYKVLRDKQVLGTVKAPSNSFEFTGLESATNYYGFRLIAVNTAGDGAELKVPMFTTQAVYYGGTIPPKEEEEPSVEEETEPANPSKPVPFKDIETSFAKKEIEALYQRGIVKGMSENMYSPNEKVTRVEFASMLVRALELQEESEIPLTFEDVQRTAWYVPELGTAILNGVAKGFSDKEFRPHDPITREQASKMLSNSFYTGELTDGVISFKDADKIAVWAKPEVKALSEIAIVNGYPDGSFKPKRDLTRAECAVLIYRALVELRDGAAEYAPVTPQEAFAN